MPKYIFCNVGHHNKHLFKMFERMQNKALRNFLLSILHTCLWPKQTENTMCIKSKTEGQLDILVCMCIYTHTFIILARCNLI